MDDETVEIILLDKDGESYSQNLSMDGETDYNKTNVLDVKKKKFN